ncbi:unnamed protein product [Didymodactylos carnosus]|uniref:RING-type domain-containing protein n=1 Tax=Didymodactylos carnosus TaxID=1234261 RepID=A0A816ALZ2_9BILA|nr:unnamed protein product [Didymodactylos carnosus]CAF4472664.1 unnamed protein product [Didymodactylos carnosus]
MIEHARWFPHCAYARQLCGDNLYQKIQESKRAAQERLKANGHQTKTFSIPNINENSNSSNLTTSANAAVANRGQLQILDESTLSRSVAARLDLPISQNLLNKNFKLSIIKRCYEDQLRLKGDDFVSDCDLLLAYTILQKQIEHIDGKKENIIIPSVYMKKVQEQAKKERTEQNTGPVSSNALSSPSTTLSSSTGDADMTSLTNESCTPDASTSSVESNADSVKTIDKKRKGKENAKASSPVGNSCVLCLESEKGLACIPCGHLSTCVPCGHSLRTCPICRREIEAFVRVYI